MSDLKSLLPLSACVGTSMSLFKKLETVSGLSTENIFSSVQLKKKRYILFIFPHAVLWAIQIFNRFLSAFWWAELTNPVIKQTLGWGPDPDLRYSRRRRGKTAALLPHPPLPPAPVPRRLAPHMGASAPNAPLQTKLWNNYSLKYKLGFRARNKSERVEKSPFAVMCNLNA